MIESKNLTSIKCLQGLLQKSKEPQRKNRSSSAAGLKLLVRKLLTLTSKCMLLQSTRVAKNYLKRIPNNRSILLERSMTPNQLSEKDNILTGLQNQKYNLKIQVSSKPTNLDKFTELKSEDL